MDKQFSTGVAIEQRIARAGVGKVGKQTVLSVAFVKENFGPEAHKGHEGFTYIFSELRGLRAFRGFLWELQCHCN